jgi:hypothetical protein
MGDFEELAFNHSTRQPFGVGFSMKGEDKSQFVTDSSYSANPKTKLPRWRALQYLGSGFSLRVGRVGNKYSAEFKYDPEKDSDWKFSWQRAAALIPLLPMASEFC